MKDDLDQLEITSMFFFKTKTTSVYLRIEDNFKKNKKTKTAQRILPGNLTTNKTTKSKLEQFKQKINLNWLCHNSKLT